MIFETETKPLAMMIRTMDKYVDARSPTMADILIRKSGDAHVLAMQNSVFDLRWGFVFDNVVMDEETDNPEVDWVAVPSSKLAALIDSIGAEQIRLEAKSNSYLTIKTAWEAPGGGRFSIRQTDSFLYDEDMIQEEIPWQLNLNGALLATALKRAITAAGAADYRFEGIWFHIKDEKLRIFAVDGRRICYQEIEDIQFTDNADRSIEVSFQIPIKTAKAMISLVGGQDLNVFLGFVLTKTADSDVSRLGKIHFSWADIVLTSKIIEIEMLPYNEVLGQMCDTYVITVDSGEFNKAVKQAAFVRQQNKVDSWITISVEGGKLMVKASNVNGEEAKIAIECEANVQDIPIRKVNPAFVLDIMPFMGEDALQIKYGDIVGGVVTNNSIIMMDSDPDSEQGFQYGFMPIRMNE